MLNFRESKLKKLFFLSISIIVLFYTSKLMLIGSGQPTGDRNIFLLVILMVFLSASKKSFWILAFPMTMAYAIYSPIGSVFGKPTYQYIASLFATDILESKEFFSQIPKINYTYPFLIIAGVLLYRFITQKNNIKIYRNKTFIIIMVLFSMMNQPPADYFKEILKSSIEVKNELVKLNEIKKESDWGVSELSNSKYDTYILIIGESARKDYLNAYGYPINNTPFMSSSNGHLVDGLTSGGTNTISSLRLMLTKPDTEKWEANYSLDFIDLVNSAGVKTYWISNQGYLGQFDTPISAIASKSDSKFFIKSGDSSSKNTSDFMLVEKIENIVKENSEKKLIVVHLYGSHPSACARILDYKSIAKINDKKYGYLNCYISSINKTDDVIRDINKIMLSRFHENNETYSIMYFSDHGLAHREVDGVILFNNNKASKLHYDVPLFKISSDDTERNECKSFKSGLNFVNGIASWIGIKNEKLDPEYSLFDCNDDSDDFGLRGRINRNKNELDPAIDLTGK